MVVGISPDVWGAVGSGWCRHVDANAVGHCYWCVGRRCRDDDSAQLTGSRILLGVVGAWIGFALGAVAGMLVDVVAGTGWVLALSGHVAACAVAVGLAFSRRRLPPSRTGTATGSSAR